MDPKELRELIETVSRSNLATFELEREGLKLRLVKDVAAASAPAGPAPPPPVVSLAPEQALPPPQPEPGASEGPVEPGLVDLRSPIVGTFFRSPSPDAPVFVDLGSRVRKGQVLCIVEAMKLMNEIESEIDAEVVEILVANGQPVEYGEVLFRLRPHP